MMHLPFALLGGPRIRMDPLDRRSHVRDKIREHAGVGRPLTTDQNVIPTLAPDLVNNCICCGPQTSLGPVPDHGVSNLAGTGEADAGIVVGKIGRSLARLNDNPRHCPAPPFGGGQKITPLLDHAR